MDLPKLDSVLELRQLPGLDAFRMIAGLLRKEYRKAGRISLSDFYGLRSLRIFPAYYAFLFDSVSCAVAALSYQLLEMRFLSLKDIFQRASVGSNQENIAVNSRTGIFGNSDREHSS